MSDNEPGKPRKSWGCLQWAVVGVVLILSVSLWASNYSFITFRSMQMRAASNCRQIIGLLLTYASDHEGHFPDKGHDPESLSSNTVFRELFKERLVQDEPVFISLYSPFVPDKKIGEKPDFKECLKAGENHWMMVAGLKNSSPAAYPLVLENALSADWPPHWLYGGREPSSLGRWFDKFFDPPPKPTRGRSWPGSKIIIGHVDARIQIVELEKASGEMTLPKSYLQPEGQEPLPSFRLLDIEVP